jgi:hypothetical protein
MPDSDSKLQRSTNLLNAWFVKLDKEKRNLLKSGRFRLLMLSLSILILLLLNLVGVLAPGSSIAFNLQPYTAWMHGFEIVLLLLLFWQIWRELLQPLLRLCDWADMMRGVNLDAKVELEADSDFSELASDINMLGNMIKNLSRDTEIQLQKHTDHISRESRSLAILYDVASSINLSYDLNELFEKSLDSLCSNLNASAGIIRQFQGRKQKDIVASFGIISCRFSIHSTKSSWIIFIASTASITKPCLVPITKKGSVRCSCCLFCCTIAKTSSVRFIYFLPNRVRSSSKPTVSCC